MLPGFGRFHIFHVYNVQESAAHRQGGHDQEWKVKSVKAVSLRSRCRLTLTRALSRRARVQRGVDKTRSSKSEIRNKLK